MADKSLIIFSDLDGTLLDHHDYSYKAALPALKALQQQNIPLILASSKTALEIAPLRAEMGFAHCPAIVENGAGILPARHDGKLSNETYEKLISQIAELPVNLRASYTGFSDMNVQDIIDVTGLSKLDAERAKMRSFSEPGLWTGDNASLSDFIEHLEKRGIAARRGGRFLTLSFGGNKADCMAEIMTDHKSDKQIISIALGDAPNDVEMLQAADHGVVILNTTHDGIESLSEENARKIIRSTQSGPAGWNQEVLKFIAHYVH